MNKILDFKIDINNTQIKEYIKKETQLNNVEFPYIINLEEELQKFFSKFVFSLDCTFYEDYSVSVTPIMFNDNSIINNNNILIENGYVVFPNETENK